MNNILLPLQDLIEQRKRYLDKGLPARMMSGYFWTYAHPPEIFKKAITTNKNFYIFGITTSKPLTSGGYWCIEKIGSTMMDGKVCRVIQQHIEPERQLPETFVTFNDSSTFSYLSFFSESEMYERLVIELMKSV